MYFGILALALPWLVLFLLFELLMISGSVEDGEGGKATGWLVFGLIILHLAGVVNLFWPFQHPLPFFGYLALYIAIGACWAVYKWQEKLHDWSDEADGVVISLKKAFLSKEGLPVTSDPQIPEGALPAWAKFREEEMTRNSYYKEKLTVPRPKSNIGTIVAWATYFPFSLLGTVITRWLTTAVRVVVFKVFGGFLDKRSSQAQNKVAERLAR